VASHYAVIQLPPTLRLEVGVFSHAKDKKPNIANASMNVSFGIAQARGVSSLDNFKGLILHQLSCQENRPPDRVYYNHFDSSKNIFHNCIDFDVT